MTSVAQLGYLGFEVSSPAAWDSFATEVLGLEHVGTDEDGTQSYRMDSYSRRIFVSPGPADDLGLIGWELADASALNAMSDRLRSFGIEVIEGTESEAAARRVRRLVKFLDPAGIPSELFYGPARTNEPFRSKVLLSGFNAEEHGLGHLVISARSQQESKDFYCNVLGLRLSDHIVADIHGYHVNLAFLHANARHHSIAFGDQQRKRIHHFMLEVQSMDDVGLAFDRTLRSGLRIMQTLGRHPNDRMFSFYAKTPSGFQFEFGWGARLVDDKSWVPDTYDRISEWGHHPPAFLAPQNPPTGEPK